MTVHLSDERLSRRRSKKISFLTHMSPQKTPSHTCTPTPPSEYRCAMESSKLHRTPVLRHLRRSDAFETPSDPCTPTPPSITRLRDSIGHLYSDTTATLRHPRCVLLSSRSEHSPAYSSFNSFWARGDLATHGIGYHRSCEWAKACT